MVELAGGNNLRVDVDNTEAAVSFRRKGKSSQPLCILGEEVEDYKYLGVNINRNRKFLRKLS